MQNNNHQIQLASATTLFNGKYTIESVAGINDFGITYKATQDGESDFVYVLQYSPLNVAEEELEANRNKFVEDARMLANFDHENIVKVLALFEENGVVYMVIPLIEGLTQKELLKVSSDLPKYVPEIEKVKEYIKSLGVADELLSKKPHFLYLPEYRVMLVHFGSVQVFNNVIPQGNVEDEESVSNSQPEQTVVTQKPIAETPKTPATEVPSQPEIQKQQKYKPQYAALACSACKRPLPICTCQKFKTINH
ncbi:hypothetical protein FACS1894182_01090 [Bacteroidia bacterium]|nr:hypothetical protein FACS1894182_01090 [Bacteroidia bacterium]